MADVSTPETQDLPARTGVVGGGRMGAGVAHALLTSGSAVTVVEVVTQLESARKRVEDAVRASAARGTLMGTAGAALDQLDITADVARLAGCGLVVEAVPEDVRAKSSALQRISDAVEGDCVIATNTSSLPIAELALVVQQPSRFLGMHFFNPVPASRLVEVVVGPRTDSAITTRVVGWVDRLGKAAVVVRDSPGFASSRLGLALGLEAIRMVEEAVASPADIDTAMELGYKHPTGPLRLTDLVGLDVRLGIAEHLARTLGERFAAPQLLKDMVAAGRLGRKSGQGFYTWTD
jgi:3-hydroxybutyryl-CoA dehydrogenase